MEERIRPTRSGLFAIELLIAVGVFILCAAICIGLFIRAEVISADSADLNRAVTEAKNVAECYKAAGGDLARAAELCGGTVTQGILWIHYDKDWNRLPGEEWDGFQVSLFPEPSEGGERIGGVQVTAADKPADPLLYWQVAALPEVTP